MEQAPWWFVPLATFLGVILAQGVVVLLFFARQRAEDKRRWHEKRREVYAEYARAAFKAYRLYLVSNDGWDINQVDLDDLLSLVDELQLDVDLLSSEEVKAKATVLQATLDMIRMAGTLDLPMPTGEDILAARLGFEEAVREELGISKAPERLVIEADTLTKALPEIFKYAFASSMQNLLTPWRMFSRRKIVVHRPTTSEDASDNGGM